MIKDFSGWSMTCHINRGNKPHIMQYSGKYKGHRVIAKISDIEEFGAIGFDETFDTQEKLFEFLEDKPIWDGKDEMEEFIESYLNHKNGGCK